MALIRHLAALRPGAMASPTASAKVALRALAQRWLMLDAEIKSHDTALDALTTACAPALKEAHGMATGTAAEMLIFVGDNPERIRSEAAFAKLCGACPMVFTTPSGVIRRSTTSAQFSSKGWPNSYKTALHLTEANPLDSLLDLLEDRFTTWPVQGQAVESAELAVGVSLHPDAPYPKRMRRSMTSASRMPSSVS
jgi:hypothetical protein